MAILNFNANEVSPATTLEAIPAGRYQVVITDSELKMTKNGSGSYLELTFEIISGEYTKRRLWSRLNIQNSNPTAVEIAQRELSAICHAVEVLQPQDSSELHNRPLTVMVRCVKKPVNCRTKSKAMQPRLEPLLLRWQLLRIPLVLAQHPGLANGPGV